MPARRAPEWLTRTTFAHRGAHGPGVPENSLAAAEAAIARGFGIECDVQLSGDDVAMVFHDRYLGRLTGYESEIGDTSGVQLERLMLLGTDQSIVSLRRFLEAIRGRVPLLVEVKSANATGIVEPLCAAVCDALSVYSGPHAVMSFDPRVAEWFAAKAPTICRGLVGTDSLLNGFEHVWRNADSIERARPDFLAIDRRDLSQPAAMRWRKAGRPLLSWTIRTAAERMAARGLADGLIAEGEALA
ncbi:MAG: glycerophosphodiester phosphodiesterase family protein [Erythrobacter sp.]|uniref:glycerophosphodiester phosphodiesterase family protein n=1 Tax=Erythrobacter sp. TaxID=1042 RepID=UPI00262DF6F2|nr:glycerophosphodiester phosphodiesterase family protein [Erythrobacter sp.]MDJ0979481.1 glycerophosphodiester phosphodiesterase family protein [Erythrobacter sp.]